MSSKESRGIIFVLLAVSILIILGFLALVVGLGFVATNRNHMQNVANLVALAAIQGYVEDISPTPKPDVAKRRAEQILQDNNYRSISGSALPLITDDPGAFGPGSNFDGLLELGSWLTESTQTAYGSSCPSTTPFEPCFIPAPAGGAATGANAARVTLRNNQHPILRPFSQFFGGDNPDSSVVAEQSVATLIQRCTVYALDASGSSIYDTHGSWNGTDLVEVLAPVEPTPKFLIAKPGPPIEPIAANQPVFRVSAIGAVAPTDAECASDFYLDPGHPSFYERVYWCNMRSVRPTPDTLNPANNPGANEHFRSDFKIHNTRYAAPADRVWIDSFKGDVGSGASLATYNGPQPFVRNLLAFNAGIRKVLEQSSAQDRASLIVFTRDRVDQVPQSPAMGQDLGLYLQLINADNRGLNAFDGTPLSTPIYPNFVYRGWIQPSTASGTNLVFALQEAIKVLDNSCPATAKKAVILATDGISTCHQDNSCDCSASSCICDSSGGSPLPLYDCSSDYGTYSAAENEVLGEGGILDQLKERGIAVTTIADGEYIGPNILNVKHDPSDPDFIDPVNAASFGYQTCGEDNPFLSCEAEVSCPTCSTPEELDEAAYNGLGAPNVKFRRPLSVLAKLSFESGGIYCPIMEKCPDGDYLGTNSGDKLNPNARTLNARQDCAIYNLSKAEQAAKCVTDTVGQNPYILVRELAP